jgi:hypothetical protein
MLSLSTKRSSPVLSLISLLAACGGSSGPQATFTVSDGPQDIAAVPWPSDLLLDSGGHIAVSALPLDDTVVKPSLIQDLNTEQDGFGVFSGVYFPIGRYRTNQFGVVQADTDTGVVDSDTIDGNVHLLPLRCADGRALDQIELPLYTVLRGVETPQRIYARPERGVVLKERCTYAYVVTNKVHTDKGALGPSDDLRALLGGAGQTGRLQHAYDVFAPLRMRLASGPIAVADVAAATVFTTHSLSADYLAARATLLASDKPKATVTHVFARTATADDDGSLEDLMGTATAEQPGNDNPGGIAHAGIEYVIQGQFDTIDFLGGGTKNMIGVESTAIGIVERDGSGKPKVKGTISVPFTLVIPHGADVTALKFAVVQHGLGVERSHMVTVANTLALQGIASILIDLPFHGSRNKDAVDTTHAFTMAAGADGFGESMSDPSYAFFDVTGNTSANVAAVLPRAIRSAFFQSVCDIQQAFRLMAEGDLSAIGAREPRLATLKIDATHELYVGESFGSMIGTIVSAFQPKLEGTVLDVDGGGTIFPLLLNSATFAPVFGTLLNASLGTHAGETSDPVDTDWGYNLAEQMLDIGDSLAYAQFVVQKQDWGAASTETDRPCHVLQLSAYRDELVPNPANLAVARGMGLQPVTLSDGMPPDLTGWPEASASTAPLSANAGGQTAAFVQFNEAGHTMLTSRNGAHKYDLSNPDPPFPARTTPIPIVNPTDRVNSIVSAFAVAILGGQAPTIQ